jgi:acyl-CoA reductase-like NAD-dependent aldehyde dehydrogenase
VPWLCLLWSELVAIGLQVMTVIPFDSDNEAVAIANDCPFGLGSSVFSGSTRRARMIASQLEAGMTSINDFNATYMCQVSHGWVMPQVAR